MPNARRRAVLLVASLTTALVGVACGGADTVPPVPPAAPSSAAVPSPTAAPSRAAPAPRKPPVSPAAAPVGTHGGGAGAAPSRCTSAHLTVTLGQGDAGAGSVYRPLVFTNTAARACQLRGFPGVSYVAGDDGHQVGPAARMVGERGPQVRVEPGRSVVAALQLVQVGAFDPAVCRPTPVRGLRVYPPGDAAALFVSTGGTGCAGTPPGPQLTVRTIAAR